MFSKSNKQRSSGTAFPPINKNNSSDRSLSSLVSNTSDTSLSEGDNQEVQTLIRNLSTPCLPAAPPSTPRQSAWENSTPSPSHEQNLPRCNGVNLPASVSLVNLKEYTLGEGNPAPEQSRMMRRRAMDKLPMLSTVKRHSFSEIESKPTIHPAETFKIKLFGSIYRHPPELNQPDESSSPIFDPDAGPSF